MKKKQKTCYFSHGAEHFQLFGFQGWNLFKIIAVGGIKKEEKNSLRHTARSQLCEIIVPHRFLQRCSRQLPKNPRDQEVKAALDLGAVDEAVNVAGVHGLSVFSAGAFTHCRGGQTPL